MKYSYVAASGAEASLVFYTNDTASLRLADWIGPQLFQVIHTDSDFELLPISTKGKRATFVIYLYGKEGGSDLTADLPIGGEMRKIYFLKSESNEPNQAPEPTPMSVTPRAPSSTSRASHERGSS